MTEDDRDTDRPEPIPTLPPPPTVASPQTEMVLAKLGMLEKTLEAIADGMLALTSAVHENTADVRTALGVATLAGNQVKDVAEQLEQTILEFREAVEVLGGVKESAGSAIDMASKAIALGENAVELGEKAVKLGSYSANMTKQVADHLHLELVDEVDSAPILEIVGSSG